MSEADDLNPDLVRALAVLSTLEVHGDAPTDVLADRSAALLGKLANAGIITVEDTDDGPRASLTDKGRRQMARLQVDEIGHPVRITWRLDLLDSEAGPGWHPWETGEDDVADGYAEKLAEHIVRNAGHGPRHHRSRVLAWEGTEAGPDDEADYRYEFVPGQHSASAEGR